MQQSTEIDHKIIKYSHFRIHLIIGVIYFPGGTNWPEGICQEANQAEPTRQHQQQGEEKDEELHDDETQSEREDQGQTLLQRETGKSHSWQVCELVSFTFSVSAKTAVSFSSRLLYEMRSLKRRSSTSRTRGDDSGRPVAFTNLNFDYVK